MDATIDGATVTDGVHLHLEDRTPEQHLRDMLRVRASLTGEDVVVRFAGDVHAHLPGERARKLFGFDGFNVARVQPADGGYDLLAREAVFYLDPDTRQPLDTWTNPFTGVERDVVHVWNDPVNFPFRAQGQYGPFHVPTQVFEDTVVLTSDIFLTYPSPLQRADYPENSQSDLYEAAELFQYFCRYEDFAGDGPDVPMQVSWTRIAPWVPFMGMGDRPGHLVYHCAGTKVAGGFGALPDWMQAKVLADGAEFASSPSSMSSPNETSWTYFRKLHPEGTA